MAGAHEYRGEPGRTPAQLILGFLDARDISVPEEARARIRTCTDQSLLDRWTVRAVTALSVDELFG
ncbi:hypothetical protein AB0H88_32285 [Nonomuraea sp. NPDC050680]|jgi:hypothetical protein|uniref:hypothetical protein n=1 Tax=Nonomuraea sp. NPDC050680 TaxID=3154630 RepID=UPI0033EEEF67